MVLTHKPTTTNMKRITLIGILGFLAAPRILSMDVHLDFNGLVSNSHVIVTATCVDVRAQSDPEHRGVVGTMARFEAVETIRENIVGTAPRNGELELHYIGGSTGETHLQVCGTPSFTPGERYLLFLFNDGVRYISPIVGGSQGQFIIKTTDDGSLTYVTNQAGHAILAVNGDKLITSSCALIVTADHGSCDQEEEDELSIDPTASEYVRRGPVLPLDELQQAIRQHQFDRPSLEAYLNSHEELPVLNFEGYGGGETEVEEQAGTDDRGLGACNYQNVYISIKKNDDVPGFASWAVIDQYARDIYDVHMNIFTNTPGSSNGTWGAGNNKSEIIGWPSSSTLAANYVVNGVGYTWSPSTLAVYFAYRVSNSACSRIKEVDIAFNPTYDWTTDWNTAFQTNAVNYRAAILHETAHAWGYQVDTQNYPETYDYGQPSVMHGYRFNQIWEDGKEIHSKDAQVLRSLYDDQTTIKDVDDLGVESYKAVSGIGLVNGYVNHSSVASGETMRVYNVTVENNSNVSQSGVRVRFYLSMNRTLGGSDHLVGNYSLGSMNAVTRIINSYLLDTDGVPPGTYYIGMKVSRGGTAYNGDDRPANDVTWSTYSVQVTPSAVGLEELPTATPLTLFPNPCSELLYVVVPDEMRDGVASVVEPTGRILIEQRYTGNGTSPLVLDVAALTPGAYVVVLRADSGIRRMSRMVRQ